MGLSAFVQFVLFENQLSRRLYLLSCECNQYDWSEQLTSFATKVMT